MAASRCAHRGGAPAARLLGRAEEQGIYSAEEQGIYSAEEQGIYSAKEQGIYSAKEHGISDLEVEERLVPGATAARHARAARDTEDGAGRDTGACCCFLFRWPRVEARWSQGVTRCRYSTGGLIFSDLLHLGAPAGSSSPTCSALVSP